MPDLLIEIGTEELPLDALEVVYGHLPVLTGKALKENRLVAGAVRCEATPRRIALGVTLKGSRQLSATLEIKGPPVEKAFDAEGRPTRALEGFLRNQQSAVKDIEKRMLGGKEFVYIKKTETCRSAEKILPEIIPAVLDGLPFAKLMRWEDTGFRFPRPVRWIVALLDKKVIPVKVGDVRASNKSRGHRFLAPAAFVIPAAGWKNYQAVLKKAHVHLSLEDRKKKIRADLGKTFGPKNPDEDLITLNAHLVEEPFLIEGGFDKKYLDLPPEVLATCMKKHQKIFACYTPRGGLANRFVAVMNGKRTGLPRIRFDYENVLESRLHDARFFYEEDGKQKLEARLEQLGQLKFLGNLGSMRDQAERLSALAKDFASWTGHPDAGENLGRAALLAKADLMTQLVYEFPELQGITGREYAKRDGEKPAVAEAIGTQYQPKNLAEDYRSLKKNIGILGALFGVMDRVDLLVGAFSSGHEPTGSQDPFALRRAAGCVVKLIRSFEFRFSLEAFVRAVRQSYEQHGLEQKEGSGWKSQEETFSSLKRFFEDRISFELGIRPGSREHEIFTAVCRSGFDDLADVYDRYESLKTMCSEDAEGFMQAGKVVERTHNILKSAGASPDSVNPELLREPQEKKLFEILGERAESIAREIDGRDYAKATRLFGQAFYGPVNDFFDQVMVNVEDTEIRDNRKALMKQINSLYTRKLADLSILSRIDN